MKLLHTSDWHIGRSAGQLSREADFRAVLAEIVAIARDQRPDFVIHTGDLFDAFRPAVTDMMLGFQGLQALARVAPVVVLAGNHDSPALFRLFDLVANGLSAGDDPAAQGRILFVDQARTPAEGGILDLHTATTEQRLRLAPLPFVHANRFLDAFRSPETATRDYADHLRQVQELLGRGLLVGHRPEDDVLVFAAHLYIEGALPSHSERRLELTETYATAASGLPQVAYAALGHIHRPQAVTRPGIPCRYAGSPLQLDFGETGEDKSLVLVTADPSRPAHPEVLPLSAGRRLTVVEGTLEHIAAQADTVDSAIVRVVVNTETPTPHLAEQVAELLPKAAIVSVDERCAASQVRVLDRSAAEVDAEPDLTELFVEYLAKVGTRGADANHVRASFSDLLAEANVADVSHDCAPLPEEAVLAAVLDGRDPDPAVRERLLVYRAAAAPRNGSPTRAADGAEQGRTATKRTTRKVDDANASAEPVAAAADTALASEAAPSTEASPRRRGRPKKQVPADSAQPVGPAEARDGLRGEDVR